MMVIIIKPIGDLRDNFGHGHLEIEIPDAGCISDLLEAIHERWGNNLPSYMWDQNLHRLRGPVFLITDGKILDDLHVQLRYKQEVTIMKALAGG